MLFQWTWIPFQAPTLGFTTICNSRLIEPTPSSGYKGIRGARGAHKYRWKRNPYFITWQSEGTCVARAVLAAVANKLWLSTSHYAFRNYILSSGIYGGQSASFLTEGRGFLCMCDSSFLRARLHVSPARSRKRKSWEKDGRYLKTHLPSRAKITPAHIVLTRTITWPRLNARKTGRSRPWLSSHVLAGVLAMWGRTHFVRLLATSTAVLEYNVYKRV